MVDKVTIATENELTEEFKGYAIFLQKGLGNDLGQFSIHSESELAVKIGDAEKYVWIPKSILEIEYVSTDAVAFKVENWVTLSFLSYNLDKRGEKR